MIDLRLIESFMQAARHENFSAAATAFRISPGAMSQNIKALEDKLGARLFTRTTRQVRLTSAGQLFLERCGPALEALNDATAAVAGERDTFQGTLKVTSATAFGRAFILPLAAKFQKLHPELTIELSLSDTFVDLIAEGFDLGIRGGILPANEYISRLIVPITPLVCAAPSYFKEHGKPIEPEDVLKHRLIGMRSSATQRVFPWEFAAEKGSRAISRIEIEPNFIVNDVEAVAEAAAEGVGLAQVGSNISLPRVRQGRLELALTDFAVQSRGMYAVYPTRRYAPRKLTAFIAFVADAFADDTELVWSR
jgi:DNA-binding transcriptional LysR family regulator